MKWRIDRGGSDRASGVIRLRWASSLLALAAALSACGGDDSKPAATQDAPTTTPAASPSPSSPTTTTPPATPAPEDSQSSTPPTTPSSADEGQGNKPLPIAPAPTGGQNNGDTASTTPPAGAGGSAGQQTPPAMQMPPAMQTPPPTAAFNPCPTDGSACKIMPLGDSITFGTESADGAGYRLELFRRGVADGHAFTLVGRAKGGPTTSVQNQAFPVNNEGYPGATISTGNNQLANRLDGAFAANTPNIILLHIGTNDILQNTDLANAPKRLGALLDQIAKDAPDALVLVAQIIPLASKDVSAYNTAIPDVVQQHVAQGQHFVLLDMFSVFQSNGGASGLLTNLGVHPNAAGYKLMGDTWYEAIKDLLP